MDGVDVQVLSPETDGQASSSLKVNGAVDLRFHEQKIRDGALAIAQSFAAIKNQELWRHHAKEYQSFESYCAGEWQGREYSSILRMIGTAQVVTGLQPTGTSGAITASVPVAPPTNMEQGKALQGASKSQRGEVWERVVENAGGDPDAVTGADVRAEIDRATALVHGQFPIGCRVSVKPDTEGSIYADATGVVAKHESHWAVVELDCGKGGGTAQADIPYRWLRFRLPPHPLGIEDALPKREGGDGEPTVQVTPEAKPGPYQPSSKDWEEAIELLELARGALDELGETRYSADLEREIHSFLLRIWQYQSGEPSP